MTDWLMVVITAIYMVATIAICYFNRESANAAKEQTKATREQIKEMIEQYNSLNRPFVTVRFDVIRSGLMCFIIENEGPVPAHDVKIRINREFIDNIKEADEKSRLQELNESVLYLASKQKITVLLGSNISFDDIAKEIAKIDISYDSYTEYTEIDINQYRFMIIYRSPVEDAAQHLKKIKEDSKDFHKALLKKMDKPGPVQNIVVHSATEKDADKFCVFKELCLKTHQTTGQLAQRVNMDEGYVSVLLSELQMVDRLVAYTYYEMEDGKPKELWYRK